MKMKETLWKFDPVASHDTHKPNCRAILQIWSNARVNELSRYATAFWLPVASILRMSGASSSGAGGKRRRGPVPRPRGEPSSPVQPQRDERTIRYLEAERIPAIKTRRLKDHTLLMFEMGTFESDMLDRFVSLELLHHRNINWELVDQLGQRDRLERLLGPKWRRVLACDWPQYKELTIEFHSTFMYDDSEFESLDAISFSLGRRVYEMSIPQFAVVCGFYTEDEALSPDFVQVLRGATKKDRDFCLSEVDLSEFWATIADAPFSTSMLESNIRDPLLRYIHRVLACTVVGRSSGEEKVNWIDLFCLYCMVTGREANVACVLATSLARARRGGGRARLDMGPYIYRMAEYLGVFDRYRPDLMILGPLTTPIDLRDLQRAGIVERDNPPRWAGFMVGPQVMLPQGTPEADVVMGSIPTHRQRPVFRRDFPPRQYPLREPIPDPLTLESLCHRMDGYHDQYQEWREHDQKRQDDAMRA
ncbi:hypothetical protein E3N88_30037 [Mikania micrantha]|uniref:Arabidopsis retrotransposon Orf1 C-terminal domain-containing protein n=1 Tax=Mikania micrantha TaxID=192012 RepID=A0A5N6MNC9_9ASTR|nr:hypothetical protein E3N88_30037 [Mikania micrantha]